MKKSNLKTITSKIDTGRGSRVTGTLPLSSSATNKISSSSIRSSSKGAIPLPSSPGTGRKVLTSSSSSTSSGADGGKAALTGSLITNSNATSTFPRSKGQAKASGPLPPSRKDPNVRAFVKANARVSNMTALFHDEIDTQNLSPALVRNARKSGVLNLSGRGLLSVPLKVWRINELDENEKSAVSMSLDDTSEDKWWEFVELQKLIVANNYIKDIPCDVSNLLSLQTLDAHDNQIVTVSKDVGKLGNLTKLDLSHNQIILLPEEIGELKRLVELKLSHNLIQEVPSSFGKLGNLRNLDLSHNNLTSFPGDLGFMSFLQSLNVANNRIKTLPEEIGSLTGLRSLDLSENCITECPAGLSDLTHLEVVYLQKNKLTEIPDFSKAKNLKELYLQNNLIKVLNSEVFGNTKLSLLDLRMNKVDELVVDCEDLEFLERFYLDNNDLAALPDELALLPSLKALTLDGNPIRGIRVDILQRGTIEILKYLRGRLKLSESMESSATADNSPAPSSSAMSQEGKNFNAPATERKKSKSPSRRKSGGSSIEELAIDPYKCKASRSLALASRQVVTLEPEVFQLAADNGVSCIDLSKNLLVNLPPSIELCYEWLAELKLDSNKLENLPSVLSKCSRLQYLSAQNNSLCELPQEFSHLKALREINLGYNRFDAFPSCLYELPALEIVGLASNKLSVLEPENLQKLRRLAVLDVRNNNIGIMPPEIGLLNQLKSLSIEGNAFRVPNYQVISQGTDAILSYLRNRIVQK